METELLEIQEAALLLSDQFFPDWSYVLVFGINAATMAELSMIVFNNCFSMNEHRLFGLFLMIPFTGSFNGFSSDFTCAAVFLCAVGTGSFRLK